MAGVVRSGAFARPPRSAGDQSLDGSDRGSVLEEEGATALPAFKEKETTPKERKERGFRGVLPFQRKRKDKDKDKDKGKDKDWDTRTGDSEGPERSGSALGEYASQGSLRGRANAEGAEF
jgi:hypothetical protein